MKQTENWKQILDTSQIFRQVVLCIFNFFNKLPLATHCLSVSLFDPGFFSDLIFVAVTLLVSIVFVSPARHVSDQAEGRTSDEEQKWWTKVGWKCHDCHCEELKNIFKNNFYQNEKVNRDCSLNDWLRPVVTFQTMF